MSDAGQESGRAESGPSSESAARGAPRGASRSGTTRGLVAMGPVVRLGFLAVGVASALQELSSALERLGASERGLIAASSSAISSLFFYGLIGWLAGRLLPAVAEFLEQQGRRADSAARTRDLVEGELIPAVTRLAEALTLLAGSGAAPQRDGAQAAADIRGAIRSANWMVAEDLIRALDDRAPGDPEAARLARELEDAKQSTAQSLLARVEAAREASDPERVLEHRDALVPLIHGDRLREIDRELAKWFMGLIHKRLRAGTVRPDVATLAARVAQSLDDTPEGASLRAALPTLRRSAGLCARCAQPYTGIADACPVCLGTVSFPAYQAGAGDDLAEDDS